MLREGVSSIFCGVTLRILSMDPGMALGSLDMGSDRMVTGSQMAAVSFLHSLVGKVFNFIKCRGIVLLLVSMTARAPFQKGGFHILPSWRWKNGAYSLKTYHRSAFHC